MSTYHFDKPVEIRLYHGPLDGLVFHSAEASEKLAIVQAGVARMALPAPDDAYGPLFYERRSSAVPPIHYHWLGYGEPA